MTFSSDGKRVAASTNAVFKSIKVVLNDTRVLVMDDVHTGFTNMSCISFNPDGTRLVSSSDDGMVKVWDLETGMEVLSLKHKRPVVSAAFSPDGRCLVTACDDGVRIWETRVRE